jgi:hypothetical protein
MLHASDLRINNVILYNGEPLTVHSYDFANLDWSKAEGIGLTGEILEKCGFVKHSTTKFIGWWSDEESVTDRYHFNDRFYLDYRHDADVDRKFHYRPCSVNLQYIHQLQNLYYCLTGEEINLTLC